MCRVENLNIDKKGKEDEINMGDEHAKALNEAFGDVNTE